jgi:dolichol-phosphate mannosyltransferase
MAKITLVIIPTYNELDNITNLIPDIFDLYPENLEILVVDDNSPDGTGDYVENLTKEDSRVHLLRRPRKMGLGTAYCTGFSYAIAHKYDYICEMDADYSHDPREIGNFLREIEENDLVIGSRYQNGVNVVNWPMQRLLLSWFANLYTRCITGMPIADCTAGFKCFRREMLEKIDLKQIHSNGYAFQIEMHYKAWKKGARIKEIPIIFIDRHVGTSKMSKNIVYEAAWLVWKLRLQSIFRSL